MAHDKKTDPSYLKLPRPRAYAIEELAQHNMAFQVVRAKFPNVRTVVDSISEVALLTSLEDQVGAVPRDPVRCVGARCAVRMGYDGAVLGRSIAFLISGDQATRCQLHKDTQITLGVFDEGGAMEPGKVILLSPVSPGKRLGAMTTRANISAGLRSKGKKATKAHTRARAAEAEKIREDVERSGRAIINRTPTTVIAKHGLRVWENALSS